MSLFPGMISATISLIETESEELSDPILHFSQVSTLNLKISLSRMQQAKAVK